MVDTVDPNVRSRMMSKVRGKNTAPEIALRKALHGRGFRFRVNVKTLPGTPDIVLPKWRTVLFVHGCFWHRHEGCRFAYSPRSNEAFWQQKFSANIARDRKVANELDQLGWQFLIVWECALRDPIKLRESLQNYLGPSRHRTRGRLN